MPRICLLFLKNTHYETSTECEEYQLRKALTNYKRYMEYTKKRATKIFAKLHFPPLDIWDFGEVT
jgi:hypothetical protein